MMTVRRLLPLLLAGCAAAQSSSPPAPTVTQTSATPTPAISITSMAPSVAFLPVNATPSNATGSNEAFVDFLVTTDSQNISNTDQHFIARITNPDAIAIARGELAKTEGFQIIAGTIVKESAPWNYPQWSFYLDPDTVTFGEMFIEVCDANVEYVQDNLATVGTDFLPNNFWCPWSTRVLEELSESLSDAPSDVPSQAPTLVSPMPTPFGPTVAPLTFVDFVASANRDDISDTSQHFIVRITDLANIQTAREELTAVDNFLVVGGTIVKESIDWNPNWSFYLAPSSVYFSAYFPETCDAGIDEVEANLAQVGTASFLPDSQWCPFSSRIISEVEATGAPSAAPSADRRSVGEDVSSSLSIEAMRFTAFAAFAFTLLLL
ncbi:hypothetical protein MPSEU_000610600 [Mayamaea pseudoterrestris]|nr:hypothetical protein MPSEU_000610600 [Mayamaea pseudoterrestris]